MDSKCIDGNYLSTGVGLVDAQHQNFFKLLKKMRSQLLSPNKEMRDEIIEELYLYCLYHFETEERIFDKYNIELFSEHLEQHKNFAEKIENFKIDSILNKVDLNTELVDFLEDWLITHIENVDQIDFKRIQTLKET